MSKFSDFLKKVGGVVAGSALVAGPVGVLAGSLTSIFSLFSKKNLQFQSGNTTIQTGDNNTDSFSLAILFKNPVFIVGLSLTILGGIYYLFFKKRKGGRA